MNIFEHPKFKEAQAINLLAEALSPPLKRSFCYGGVKNEVLILRFDNHVAVAEFGISRDRIKEKMRVIYKDNNLKSVIKFREIRAKEISVETREKMKRREKPKSKSYTEKSSGSFDNKIPKDSELYGIIEEIREGIKKYREVS